MKQKITFKLLLAVMLMTFCGNGVWGQTTWKQVTKIDEINLSSRYIIASGSTVMGKEQNNKQEYKIPIQNVSKQDDKITLTIDEDKKVAHITFSKKDKKWYLQDETGYIQYKGEKKLNTITNPNTKCEYDITLTNKSINIKHDKYLLQYNQGSPRFTFYKSLDAIQLYKEVLTNECKSPSFYTGDFKITTTTYEVSQNTLIKLKSATSGATIKYNKVVDGIHEISNATYTDEGIRIDKACTIEAWAEKSEMTKSNVSTVSFTIGKNSQHLTFKEGTEFTCPLDQTFNKPTLEGAKTNVTYSSSNSKVAEVDPEGNLTLVGVGNTKITAIAEETTEYNSDTAYYTLVVVEGAPTENCWSKEFISKSIFAQYKNPGDIVNLAYGSTLTPTKGSNPSNKPFLNKSGEFRVYHGNCIKIQSPYPMNQIVFNATKDLQDIECTSGTISINNNVCTWTGDAKEITFNIKGSKGGLYFKSFSISYFKAYELTISAAGYATFSAQQAYKMPAELQGGIIIIEGNVASVDYIYGADSVVPAEEALIIKSAANTYTLPVTTTTIAKNADNQLKPAFTNSEIKAAEGNEIFVFAKGSNGLGFYWQKGRTDGAAVSNIANKAYLELPISAGANGLRFVENETTGIENVETGNANTSIYSITGVRVNTDRNNLPKGIYIINGKKVLVK